MGAEFATQLAEAGINLLLVARKPGPLEGTAATARAHGVEVRTLAVDLMRILLLSPIFLGTGIAFKGILEAQHQFTWPAFARPTVIPYCCCTAGSEAVASIRPNSMGGPAYLSNVDACSRLLPGVLGSAAAVASLWLVTEQGHLVRFRDGRIQIDEQIAHRRDAAKELAALPPVQTRRRVLVENAQLTQITGELSRSVAGLRAAAQNADNFRGNYAFLDSVPSGASLAGATAVAERRRGWRSIPARAWSLPSRARALVRDGALGRAAERGARTGLLLCTHPSPDLFDRYDVVIASTGFAPYRPAQEPVPPHLQPVLEQCRPYYERLYTSRVTI